MSRKSVPPLIHLFITAAAVFALTPIASADDQEKVKVFVLTGQSNMVGQAKQSLLEYQLTQPGSRDQFAHWRAQDGSWAERDDVWIKFLDRKGKLTVGFGRDGRIGPELEFGHVIGDRYDEPVVLIKTAWGGKSLWRDFRPPSSGLPAETSLQQLLEHQRKRSPDLTMEQLKQQFGQSYRDMLSEITATLADLGGYFPELQGRSYELAGAVWFQGWNDMINPDYTAEYTANLANLIRDLREDLDTPELPFVIGVMGVDGKAPNARQQVFREAQAAPASFDEFKNNVAAVQTSAYWDVAAHVVFKKGWKEHVDEWNTVGSDFPYHYLGSVKTMHGIGRGFADAMLKLVASKNAPKN